MYMYKFHILVFSWRMWVMTSIRMKVTKCRQYPGTF